MSDEKCGAECRDGTPCENYPVQGADRCRMHGGTSTGPSSEAAEDNLNALKTGDNVAADKWIEFMSDNADEALKASFKGHFERFRDRGADPAVAARLAVMWSKADYNNMELIKEDFMRPMYHEGEYVDDVFDDRRDSSALKNEREARLMRREDMLSPYSRDTDMADGFESIADVISDIQDS